jgi:hypothetical protein
MVRATSAARTRSDIGREDEAKAKPMKRDYRELSSCGSAFGMSSVQLRELKEDVDRAYRMWCKRRGIPEGSWRQMIQDDCSVGKAKKAAGVVE